ncbi:hypothetical protein AA0Y32_16400 [Georgenia phoenicis]|uniref:HD domain-containing protein n=1 Tax=unclassified Georgenia TaxID=2626815 RepID=UPI0039AF38D4
MSLADAPQWLVSAFVRSAVAVGATAPREQIQRTARELVERWQEPERSFHNLRHLIDVLARVDELAEETHVPDVVRLAAWYHGAVFNSSAQVAYARRGGEDEVASAELAREQLAALGVPEDVTRRVHELITTLAGHDADEHDVDALALCDADLGTLAVEPQRYSAYKRAIRQEYAHIPEVDYVASRLTILSRLLQRRRLFVSPFSLSWEEPARENLTAELSHLKARLAELGGTEPEVEEAAHGCGSATSWPSRGPAAAPPPAVPPPVALAAPRPAEEDAPAPPPPVRAPEPRGAVTPDEAGDDDESALSGIERDPDFELRRRIRRKRRAAAQLRDEAEPSPSALFRPPPRLPRS